MSLPESAIKERLSVAYVSAVVARCGMICKDNSGNLDVGIDVEIQKVNQLPNRKIVPTGYILHGQIKATTTSELHGDMVTYDLDADAYNKLVSFEGGVAILILFCLPVDPYEWLYVDEAQFILRNCCYWTYLAGEPTQNNRSQRIRISRSRLFTPEVVPQLLEWVKSGILEI